MSASTLLSRPRSSHSKSGVAVAVGNGTDLGLDHATHTSQKQKPPAAHAARGFLALCTLYARIALSGLEVAVAVARVSTAAAREPLVLRTLHPAQMPYLVVPGHASLRMFAICNQ